MTFLTRRNALALCAAALCGSCTSYTFTTSTPVARFDIATAEETVNRVRTDFGKPPLRLNPLLLAAAREQAGMMARRDELSHDLGEGFTLRERVRRAGYVGSVGENVASGQKTLESALDGWLQSGAHRHTLLSEDFKSFGIAVTTASSGTPYWAMIFGQ